MTKHDRVVSLAFFEIDPVEVASQQSDAFEVGLPRHLTIAPPIEHDRGATSILREALAQCAMQLSTFEITGGVAARLGANGEFSARLIIPTKEIQEAHWSTIATLGEIIEADQHLEEGARSEAIERMMYYSGARYNPHITDRAGDNLGQGETMKISHIHLGQRPGSISDRSKISQVIHSYDLTDQ